MLVLLLHLIMPVLLLLRQVFSASPTLGRTNNVELEEFVKKGLSVSNPAIQVRGPSRARAARHTGIRARLTLLETLCRALASLVWTPYSSMTRPNLAM